MEHKLILGGEKYLPYARSRIRALRAAGFRYARQPFDFPDAEGHVEIVDGIEYIYIKGKGCLLALDSGVVDVHTIAPLNPRRYLDGILYETGYVGRYNTAFVPTDPPTQWRVNPGNSGQLSGIVSSTPNLHGKVPYDAQPALSFRSKTEADEILVAKKSAAILCPASIFTGRCRLYVQSIYGRSLYAMQGAKQSGTPNPQPSIGNSGATPAIYVDAYPRNGQTLQPVLVTTSSGVHLDAAGNHWLFCPTSTGVTVYPLKSSKCGEGLRAKLVGDELNAQDKEHLEAYILADCRPDVANKVEVGHDKSVSSYSMGYGWHWNWTGLTADIVVHGVYDQDAFHQAMVSTHYRLTMLLADGEWSVTCSIVEGPTNWAVQRSQWVIAHPDFASLELAKLTPRISALFECDAPFYVFYQRDEIQICRVRVAVKNDGPGVRTQTRGYAASNTYGANDITHTSLGLRDGWLEERAPGTNYFAVTFTCGSAIAQDIGTGRTQSGTRYEVNNKAWDGTYTAGYGSDPIYGTRPFEVGYPSDSDIWEVQYLAGTLDSDRESAVLQYDWKSLTLASIYYSQAIVVVPTYDAEAIYLKAQRVKYTIRSGQYNRYSTDTLGFRFVERSRISGGQEAIRYGYEAGGPASGASSVSSNPTFLDSSTSTELDMTVLVCHAGEVAADFGSTSQFYDNNTDTISASFSTFTGTALNNDAVAISPGHIDSVGAGTGVAAAAPVLVGWI